MFIPISRCRNLWKNAQHQTSKSRKHVYSIESEVNLTGTEYVDMFASVKVCELPIIDILRAEMFANLRFLEAIFFTHGEKYF